MSKFKIKMKLTGFELEIEGSREDIPNIQQALAQQLGGILQPGAGLIDGAATEPDMRTLQQDRPEVDITPTPKTARKRPSAARGSKPAARQADADKIEWPRDVSGFGSPSQSWTTAEKALWTLYVAQEALGRKELTSVQIRDTFNAHYRAAKAIAISNIGRDLNTLKVRNPALVGFDTSQNPGGWFLTQAGTTTVQARVSELNSSLK